MHPFREGIMPGRRSRHLHGIPCRQLIEACVYQGVIAGSECQLPAPSSRTSLGICHLSASKVDISPSSGGRFCRSGTGFMASSSVQLSPGLKVGMLAWAQKLGKCIRLLVEPEAICCMSRQPTTEPVGFQLRQVRDDSEAVSAIDSSMRDECTLRDLKATRSQAKCHRKTSRHRTG